MKKLVSVAALALTACSTPGELRSTAPSKTFASSKTAQAVSICITNRFESLSTMSVVTARPTEQGFNVTVSARVMGGQDAAVDTEIVSKETGSSTFYRTKLLYGDQKYIDIINGCQ